MGNFKSQLEKELKNKRIEGYSEDKQKEIRIASIDEIIKEIDDRSNRYIFYCPDIALVNPLLKLVYEVAMEAKKAGYNVVILHEMNGFKAKWLYESSDYSEYRKLPVDYIINKASKKSKKQKNMYSFKVSDTLIVTDAYQDMLENILSEESLKLVQKVVLVTGYMGLASLNPSMTYEKLNVGSLIFFDSNIKDDYTKLFQTKNYLVDNYPVSTGFNRNVVNPKMVYPVIGITSIGNNDKAQQLINVFYNRYPNLNVFTFKTLARDTMDMFIDNAATCAAIVIRDKNIVTKQMVYEFLNMGVPSIIPKRREFADNKIIVENFTVEDDVFEIADQIAKFCQYWLSTSTANIKSDMVKLADDLDLNKRTLEDFGATISSIFLELQGNRERMFEKMMEIAKGVKSEGVKSEA